MNTNEIVSLLQKADGLSDRELTDALCGIGQPPQTINQACRKLASTGLIVRRKRSDMIVGNYLADPTQLCPHADLKDLKANYGSRVPEALSNKARELGRLWAESSTRPRLTREIRENWNRLIHNWINDSNMPLVIRKGGIRGSVVLHRKSGRQIIIADNSPAQWVFTCAMRGTKYSECEVNILIKDHKIPFAFAPKTSERLEVKFLGTLSSCGIDLNKLGWKLCHIEPVGLKTRKSVEDISIEQLKKHSRLLLSPSNHFVVPKEWWGLGEIPEVIEEIRNFENSMNS